MPEQKNYPKSVAIETIWQAIDGLSLNELAQILSIIQNEELVVRDTITGEQSETFCRGFNL